MSYVALCPYVRRATFRGLGFSAIFLDVCMYVCRSVFQYDFCWHCVGSLFSRRRATFREPLFAVAATFTGAFLMDVVGFPQEVILGCVDVCPSIFQ